MRLVVPPGKEDGNPQNEQESYPPSERNLSDVRIVNGCQVGPGAHRAIFPVGTVALPPGAWRRF